MTARTIKARNGAKLIEATLEGGNPPMLISRMYTVMSRQFPVPVYQGSDLRAAEDAFEKAAG